MTHPDGHTQKQLICPLQKTCVGSVYLEVVCLPVGRILKGREGGSEGGREGGRKERGPEQINS